MKYSTVLIIGGVIATGAVAYGIYKYIQHQKKDAVDEDVSAESKPGFVEYQVENSMAASPETATVSHAKEEMVSSIKKRREDAADAIEESLNTIFNDSSEKIATETSDMLKKISEDLEDLLN